MKVQLSSFHLIGQTLGFHNRLKRSTTLPRFVLAGGGGITYIFSLSTRIEQSGLTENGDRTRKGFIFGAVFFSFLTCEGK